MAVVLAVSYDDLLRPWLAVGLVGAALVFTVLTTVWLRRSPDARTRPGPVLAELSIATALVVCDGWAYDDGHAFSSSQSLGSVWPLASVLSVGRALGLRVGSAAGARARRRPTRVSAGERRQRLRRRAGAVAGQHGRLLRRRRRRRRLRDRLLRGPSGRSRPPGPARRWRATCTTVCCRRSPSSSGGRPTRTWCGWPASRTGSCVASCSATAQAAADPDDLGRRAARCRGAVRGQLRHPGRSARAVRAAEAAPEAQVGAVSRAVGEALTNAGKHAAPRRLTVFVEPGDDGGIFCSVKDDGQGFDAATVDARRRHHPTRSSGACARPAGEPRCAAARDTGPRCACGCEPPRVVLADDHPIWRDGVRADLGGRLRCRRRGGIGQGGDRRHRRDAARPRRVRSQHARRRRHRRRAGLRDRDPHRDADGFRAGARPARCRRRRRGRLPA